jgi:hypothetical protein
VQFDGRPGKTLRSLLDGKWFVAFDSLDFDCLDYCIGTKDGSQLFTMSSCIKYIFCFGNAFDVTIEFVVVVFHILLLVM